MVKVIFEYHVPVEKQSEYIQVTQDKIKPFWESNGCQSYNVWQVTESETSFVKEMLFQDMAVMKETMSLKEAEPAKELFRKFAMDVSRRIWTRKI